MSVIVKNVNFTKQSLSSNNGLAKLEERRYEKYGTYEQV